MADKNFPLVGKLTHEEVAWQFSWPMGTGAIALPKIELPHYEDESIFFCFYPEAYSGVPLVVPDVAGNRWAYYPISFGHKAHPKGCFSLLGYNIYPDTLAESLFPH